VPEFRLDVTDAVELGEMLVFLRRWLDGADRDVLAASFNRFVGHPDFLIVDLRLDLGRFAFLFGASDGQELLDADGT
jgi:hypothetical protein